MRKPGPLGPGEVDAAAEAAEIEGRACGRRSGETDKQLVCPSCGEKTGGKVLPHAGENREDFCPECETPSGDDALP